MKTAFLFSGQGAQYPGMAKELYDNFDVVRNVFRTANEVLGRDITSLCFEGTQEELDLTRNTQVCMLAVDISAGYALRESGVKPSCVAGFSLGEYAALVYAKTLGVEDAFRIVRIRADAMQEAVPAGQGAMAALMGVDGEKADEICSKVSAGYVTPANYNSPVQTVISGDIAGIGQAVEVAEKMGFTAIRLAVSAPFHCGMMKPAALRLEKELDGIILKEPVVPVYMNVTGMAVKSAEKIPEMLVNQAMSSVQWVATLENMRAAGIENFVECGAGKTLWGLTRKTLKGVNVFKAVDYRSLQDTVKKLGL